MGKGGGPHRRGGRGHPSSRLREALEGGKHGITNRGKARLPEQPAQVLAPVAHVDDLNTLARGPVNDDVARSGNDEAPVLRPELRPDYPNSGVVSKENAVLFQSVDETKGTRRTVLRDVIMDALKVGKSFERKDATAHPACLAAAALRCLNSSNTSPAGTT